MTITKIYVIILWLPLLSGHMVAAPCFATADHPLIGPISKFCNFTFPIFLPKSYSDIRFRELRQNQLNATIEVRRGRVMPLPEGPDFELQVGYVDTVKTGYFTGTQNPFTVVAVTVSPGGSMNWGYLYVFSSTGNSSVLRQVFMTGDRANDGFAAVFFKGKYLLILVLDESGEEGLCCSTAAREYKYVWSKDRLSLKSKKLMKIPLRSGAGI